VNFEQLWSQQLIKAIGPIKKLPESISKALMPSEDFKFNGIPKTGDWLADHNELGQSFDEFVISNFNKPDQSRKTIYLQPLNKFSQPKLSIVKLLSWYASIFFCLNVKVLPAISIGETVTNRVNPATGKLQILTNDILRLLKQNLPKDAFCILGLTMSDLYPDISWNFVFGQASFRERVGVYSFARYDPLFYGESRDEDYEKLLLKRICRALAHETAHMFGLKHCIFFKCLMNGSNNLRESDSRPLHLCSVCMRKLQHSIGFDIIKRYTKLFDFYSKAGIYEEAELTSQKLESILGQEAAEQIISQVAVI
jgi:archaemetzincin